jgi:protein-S-isoprenylcysteine O-methyltransferase Ste14
MSGKMRIVSKRSLIVVLLVLTGCVSESQSGIVARVEEQENIDFFGVGYADYRQRTKMFIPYLF